MSKGFPVENATPGPCLGRWGRPMRWVEVFVAVSIAGTLWAGPAGPEFQVNTYTKEAQVEPAVGMDTAGNFVIVWTSHDQDGDSSGIYAQRYDETGKALGKEFRVNTHTESAQWLPSVAMNASGTFVVTWESYKQDGDRWGIFAQRFDATGVPKGVSSR